MVQKKIMHVLESWFQPTDHKFSGLLDATGNNHQNILRKKGAMAKPTVLKITLVLGYRKD